MSNDEGLVRLSKVMAEQGLCSRREADEYIREGLVFVDGVRISELGFKIRRGQKIVLDSKAARHQEELVTIVLNKPIGYVSGQPEKGYKSAMDLIIRDSQDPQFESRRKLKEEHFYGLAPAGRLDIDSKGLIIFTQDGRIAKQLIGEDSGIEKEYLVRVDGKLNDAGLQALRFGLELDGKKLKRAEVEWMNDDQLRFVLKEGKKRQIRRMCEMVGLKVTGLKRVRIGQVRLGKLVEGQWRFLEPGEKFGT